MNKKYSLARTYLKKALEESKNCVRANILLGDIAYEEKKYDDSVQHNVFKYLITDVDLKLLLQD